MRKRGKGRERVKVLEYHVKAKNENAHGFISTVKEKVEINLDFVRRYRGFFYRIIDLTGCCRDLIEFLIEEMDGDNMVANSKSKRQKFIDATSPTRYKHGKKSYKDSSVNQAFSELHKMGLLFSDSKGEYQVNPAFFWKSTSEKIREERLKMSLTFRRNEEIMKMDIDQPLSNLPKVRTKQEANRAAQLKSKEDGKALD